MITLQSLTASPDQPAIDVHVMGLVLNDPAHKYITFHYHMLRLGKHLLNVFVTCKDNPSIINIGTSSTVYSISHENLNEGLSGQQCLELQTYIDSSNIACTDFSVAFLGTAMGVEGMRIEDIKFVELASAPECRK